MTHLVLLLVITAAVRSGACPTMCICQNHPRNSQISSPFYASVSCTNPQEVDLIVTNLDPNTSEITISNATQTNLRDFLQALMENEDKLPYFATLTIISCEEIHSDVNSTFSDFITRVRSLNLPSNKISEIPEDYFLNANVNNNNNVSVLESLDLSRNILKSLKDSPFRTLRNLEVLNLSANIIEMIAPESFVGLKSLKCLDLSTNNLTGIAPGTFRSLPSIQHLNLSNNRLAMLKEKSFSNLIKLQQLDVSFNHLNRIDLQLQLPSLVRLLLNGNRHLGESRDLLVGTGQKLQIFEAARTGLKQVPAALTHSIRTLRLAENSIRIVRCGDFDSYPLLQLLDITSNELEMIEDDALGRLDSLSILYLTNNSMETIPKSLSEKLTVLHLERNLISNITKKDLQGLSSLQVLLLNDNKIKIIEEDAFGQLGALVTLDLSRNPIQVLGAGCLSGPLSLQTLKLSNIDVISPAKEVSFPLSSTEHLITLDLAKSSGLAHQLLADTAALAASRELQELDLTSTELEFIRSDLLHYLPQLRALKIAGNRINCTQLEWLGAWMRRQDDFEYRKVTCSSPPELWGTLLIDLQEIEEITTTSTTTTTETITIQPNVTIIKNEIFSNEILEDSTPSASALSKFERSGPEKRTYLFKSTASDVNKYVPEPQVTSFKIEEEVNSNSSATGELLSMYRSSGGVSEKLEGNDRRPILVAVLATAALGAAATLTILAVRLTLRRHRNRHRHQQQHHHQQQTNQQLEEVEVANLPGVTELW